MTSPASITWIEGVCACPPCAGRVHAMRESEFAWSEAADGWVVTDWARTTPRERYYAVNVVFRECPWCGRSLPRPGECYEMGVTDGEDTEC